MNELCYVVRPTVIQKGSLIKARWKMYWWLSQGVIVHNHNKWIVFIYIFEPGTTRTWSENSYHYAVHITQRSAHFVDRFNMFCGNHSCLWILIGLWGKGCTFFVAIKLKRIVLVMCFSGLPKKWSPTAVPLERLDVMLGQLVTYWLPLYL